MFADYLGAAMRSAKYEILGDGQYYGEIPRLDGVLAYAPTLEACREQLAEVLEEWIQLCISMRIPLPAI